MDFFLPQGHSVIDLDTKMRAKLGASLEYIFDKSAGSLDIDVGKVLIAVADHRQKPGVFGRYFDLVFAIKAKRYDEARKLSREICALVDERPSFQVNPLTEAAMGDDAARFAKLLDTAEKAPTFGAPDASQWCAFDQRVEQALCTLDRIDGALAAEVRALVVQVIGSVPRSGGRSFGSASSLTLWGAIVMNLLVHQTEIDLLGGLVHEAAHLLLFGYAIDEPLVANPSDERFTSPLRSDPRPMDGVFHATFVCARLHLLYHRILERHGLFETANGMVEKRLPVEARKFQDGAATIAKHGKLTAVGESVLQSTLDYMSRAAA